MTPRSQTTPKRPTTCAYCRGPLPPPAVTGRPRTFCSAQCRAANEWVVVSRKREEMERREREKREAEWKAKEAANARRLEREYQRAIAAGGAVAANARWERLYDETYDKYGGRYGLCQWEDEDDEWGVPRAQSARAARRDVYCCEAQPPARAGDPSDGAGRRSELRRHSPPLRNGRSEQHVWSKRRARVDRLEPFAHADGCKIVVADPGFQPAVAGGRGGALAADLPVLERRHLRATRRHAYSARPA